MASQDDKQESMECKEACDSVDGSQCGKEKDYTVLEKDDSSPKETIDDKIDPVVTPTTCKDIAEDTTNNTTAVTDEATLPPAQQSPSKTSVSDDAEETTPSEPPTELEQETVNIKIVYKKQKFDMTFPLDNKISQLKNALHKLTSVPSPMQKIMYKGIAKDTSTLRELKVTNGAKFVVIGSTINDVLEVATPTEATSNSPTASTPKEPISKQKAHQKVLDKYGKPDDAVVGVRNMRERLPSCPLSGMYNKNGGKVRLTFKLELDQLWIGTKERTEKIPMSSIKAVVSEPIDGHEDYHMIGIQLGPTEASRYWVYWVPAQYADAVKDAILGKWQF